MAVVTTSVCTPHASSFVSKAVSYSVPDPVAETAAAATNSSPVVDLFLDLHTVFAEAPEAPCTAVTLASEYNVHVSESS